MVKKSILTKSIFTICFFVMLVVFGAIPISTYVNKNIIANRTCNTDVPVVESFAEQYPFDESENESPVQNEEQSSSVSQRFMSLVAKYCDFTQVIPTKVERYLDTSCKLHDSITDLLGAVDNLLQKEVVLNVKGKNCIVKLSNGYLTGAFPYSPSQKIQNNIIDFSKWLDEKNISFLTLITPDKSDDSVSDFPEVVPHGYSQMHDEYIEFLKENKLKYMDSKEVLLLENSDLYSWFYKYDHHWNVHATFLIAEKVAKLLNNEFKITADTSVINKANFKLTVYPDCFRGGYGKALGSSMKEDMEVYYPTQKTCFHVEIPSRGIDRTGSFENTLINQESITPILKYTLFLFDDNPLVRIENKTCNNRTRVLVIKKSFANSLCPYLASTVQYLDIIDPRSFDGSIRSFIEQTNPDIVITCMGVVSEEDEKYLDLK